MDTKEILTVISLLLVYSTALVGIYVNVRVKMKELDVKISNLEVDLAEHRGRINNTVGKFEECNTKEHDQILGKMDAMLEKIVELRVNQAKDTAADHVAAAAAAAVAAVKKRNIPKSIKS